MANIPLSDAIDQLETRLGWKDDGTLALLSPSVDISLSANNLISDSGRFFQDENPAVTLLNIYECQPVPRLSSAKFQAFLDDFRKSAVQQVFNDAFEKDFVDEDILTLYPRAFDNAISLKMVIRVSELIMTAVRSNRNKRLSEDFVAKLNYDLYRESPNKFAVQRANYKHTLGIASKYAYELTSVQRKFGQTRNLAKTITKGQAFDDESPFSRSAWN